VRKFKDRIAGREEDPEDVADQDGVQHTDPDGDDPTPAQEARKSNPLGAATAEPPVVETPKESAEPTEDGDAPDFARFGDHISSVMQAANEAAKRIEEEAEAHAEQLRERAQARAASTLDDARREAEKVLAEAKRLWTDAEEECRQTREQANAYAAETRRAAEAHAAEVATRAEQSARSRASDAEERARELEANVELAETRLQQLASGLFDTALRLETLIGHPVTDSEESAPEPDEEETLDAALGASVKRNEPE